MENSLKRSTVLEEAIHPGQEVRQFSMVKGRPLYSLHFWLVEQPTGLAGQALCDHSNGLRKRILTVCDNFLLQSVSSDVLLKPYKGTKVRRHIAYCFHKEVLQNLKADLNREKFVVV